MKRSILVAALAVLALGALGVGWAVANPSLKGSRALLRAVSSGAKAPSGTAPETKITGGPALTTSATTASFYFRSSKSKSTFACKLDSGIWGRCRSPRSYSSLTLGTHLFSVRAIDSTGNADATPATYSWTVVTAAPESPPPTEEEAAPPAEEPAPPADTTPPETVISTGPEANTVATSASFSFAAGEAGASFECKLDREAWLACSSPSSYSALALGTHLFSVRATDAAGNVDVTPALYSWTVDAPPTPEPPPPPPPPAESECDQTVSSLATAQSALTSAPLGSVVCLADGSYGSLSLSMRRPAPGVVLRAQNPGAATLGGVSVSGGGVAVERFVTGSLNVSAAANGVAFRRNSVTGGVYVIGNSTSYAKNVEFSGNLIKPGSGSGEKDTFMVQRFEGLRIEGNQIWVADEDGGHNDGLQTVWGGHGLIFRQNWIRGGAGSQGFFIKDGEVTNVSFEDNLIAGRPSKLPYAGAPLQFYDTVPNSAHPFYTGYGMVIRHNTIWSNPNISYVRECQNRKILVEFNVMDGWAAPDGNTCILSELTQDYNVVTGGSIGKRGIHDTTLAPTFVASSSQDWQLASGSAGDFDAGRAGITWRPADRSYGP